MDEYLQVRDDIHLTYSLYIRVASVTPITSIEYLLLFVNSVISAVNESQCAVKL